jgi:hypothetical protein
MANKRSKKSAKIAKKSAAKGLAAKKRSPKSQARNVAKPTPPRRRQPPDRKGRRQRPRALHELHQGGFLPRHVAASCAPGESKHKDVRYLDIYEDDKLDEAQLAAWIKQASKLPGWGKS